MLRTRTAADMLGEPASEGVHQGRVEFTMMMMFGRRNMRVDSAISTLHDLAEPRGTKHDEVDPKYVKKRVQHKKFLGTLLFDDQAMSHSVTPVYQEDASKGHALRSLGAFFSRRMAIPGGDFCRILRRS